MVSGSMARCPDENDGGMKGESEAPGEGLKPNFY